MQLKRTITLLSGLCFTAVLMAQSVIEVPLYEAAIPGAVQSTVSEQRITLPNGGIRISSVVRPTLKIYRPAVPNGMTVIICPGGGYTRLAYDHEGEAMALALNKAGITGMVLKYRLPNDSIMLDKSIGPLQDAQQAIRLVRQRAALWGVNPARVGIMGFSAGGHLAATAATQFELNAAASKPATDDSARPDFAILIYPVISFASDITHKGSRNNLIGLQPAPELVERFSAEMQVSSRTPPVFLVHAGDDKTVPVENSIRFYQACIRHQVPAEMHLYPAGGHGFGLQNKTTEDQWFDRLLNWLGTLDLH